MVLCCDDGNLTPNFLFIRSLEHQARQQAASTYLPIFIGINVVYILLLLGKGINQFLNFWDIAGVLGVWGMQYFAYTGILDNAANRKPGDKSLVGGSSLDLLGVTVLVQFTAVLWSAKAYWVLLCVPIYAAYSLYYTFMGESGSKGGPVPTAPTESTEEDEALNSRRQKRSERRRQKRQ